MASPTGWYANFVRDDLKSSLRRKFKFATKEKVVEMAERGRAVLNLEGRQAIQHGIEIGRGGVWLSLSEEQYRKLR